MVASRIAPRLAQATRGYATATSVRPPLTLNGLPGKYASSAFVAAANKDSKTLEAVEKDLRAVQAALAGPDAAKLRDFIGNPTLPSKEKVAGLDKLLGGKENTITRNLFEVLSANGRMQDTSKVIEGFMELMSAHRGEVVITVTSAAPLDKAHAERIEKALKGSAAAAKGKSLKVNYKVSAAIQGGLQVDFGDRSVDLSVQSRVQKLNALLAQGI
ncbi:putative ATP5-F1F0-ATPase complex, OSCP subunit [Tilletiopsis washingtonensis]|uniref:ATP synthase subunit 5, mitochondrial n=1 Tax=Tilletiopsis washingtonensis TaxID=58919 RepID=A0A316Z6T4_9BASI|nr:putative ATP5-F1F0-ATPase complex, OSCP subunit [Tilletiopsis washingtonensis]PWN97319.1 putative ATP5-F1F0-ATPase complex, OSCP subunit [Tilletiopsis washingtonensis]